jgi:hypothetical protein
MKSIVRQNSQILLRRASFKFHRAEPKLEKKSLESLDYFELKYTPNKIKSELFFKINKAMRHELSSSLTSKSGVLELKQILALEDIIKIKKLSQEQLELAYLEGVYVVERYCALADPSTSAVKSNAQKYMAEYMQQKHSEEKLYWIKKDYEAGTAGENIERDALLVKRAKKFVGRFEKINTESSFEQIHKQSRRLIKRDASPLVAFVALRRALFI